MDTIGKAWSFSVTRPANSVLLAVRPDQRTAFRCRRVSLAWVGRQVAAYRRLRLGESRQQLKWLMGGGAVVIGGFMVSIFLGGQKATLWQVVADAATLALAALPISIGIGILKYRLYEIDRLISRTLSYLIITGLLVSVFVGIVVLATDVLPFSSPVGVAASTLAAAALFNPLRLRVQRLVDRHFNRARYDAEAIVTAFTLQLPGRGRPRHGARRASASGERSRPARPRLGLDQTAGSPGHALVERLCCRRWLRGVR